MSVKILIGDVFDKLATLEDESVDCCVTSPPYWGLRDYGVSGQIGLEPTLGEHIETIVRVCEEIRRVLKPEGTFWLNYGDCYAANRGGAHQPAETLAGGKNGKTINGEPVNRGRASGENPSRHPDGHGLKHKDLCMLPNRIAIALQEAGWWVRSEIIWHKPNPMPESVTDRPSCAHEKIWLLTKSARYYYDADAVRTPCAESQIGRIRNDVVGGKSHAERGQHSKGGVFKKDKQRGHGRRHDGFNDRWDQMSKEEQQANGANLRNVWSIATHAFSEAHFATFPAKLIEPCIKAGCPKGGLVLDPFGGSGTTGMVADRLNRNAVLIELNPEYAEIAERRIQQDAGMFAEITAA